MQELLAKMEVAALVCLVKSGADRRRSFGSVMDNGSTSEMVGGILPENGSDRNRLQQCRRRCSV
jgi:hypothetical protein